MKKYFSFAMALVAMLAMVSASSGCSDDGVDYSVTIVAKTTLSLSKNAGTGRLAYEIQGADKSSICRGNDERGLDQEFQLCGAGIRPV